MISATVRAEKQVEKTHFVDIAQNHLFHTPMLKYFAHNTTIATSNHQDIFRIRMAREGEMRDHFLVAETQHIGINYSLNQTTYENSSRSVH